MLFDILIDRTLFHNCSVFVALMITDTPEVVEVPLQEVIVAAELAQPRNDVSNDVTNDATDDVTDDVSDGLAASLTRGNTSSGDDVAKSPCINDRY